MKIALVASIMAACSTLPAQPAKDQQAIEKFSRVYEVDREAVAEAERVASALALPARLQKPRRVLVYGISHGPHLFNIPTSTEVIRILGETTGACEVIITTDLTWFEPELLNTFDAVCFANATGEVMLRPVLRTLFDGLPEAEKAAQVAKQERLVNNLVAYVRGGGGFIGIHAATDCLKKTPAYGQMIGGYFDGHPWSGSQTVSVQVENPEHPLCKDVFDDSHFSIKDEIYQFKEPYDRSNVTVLLSIDLDQSEAPKKPLERADRDYPVAWIKNHGKGRVFYCSLGHNTSVFANPLVLEFLLGGIQYATGDLEISM